MMRGMTTPSPAHRATHETVPPTPVALAASLALAAVLLTGCGASGDTGPTPSTAQPAAGASGPAAPPTEQKRATPRLVATHEGGVLVLDAATGEQVADLPLDGYARVNPVGDGRHVAVSTAGGFRILDTGTWERPHGDHSHHYTAPPAWTGVTIPAGEPGHVVAGEGTTAFFDDATGRATLLPTDRVAGPGAEPRTLESAHPHHGVAVPRPGGAVVTTLGDEKTLTGIVVRDAAGTETARDERCPGVHGEAVARDALVVGCQDGVLVADANGIHKVQAPDAYGRIGNQAGDPRSEIVLGDYKVDRDATLERPRRVSLVDTAARSLELVDLPASYSFRSLGRGPAGEALVLGTDGKLHVIDQHSGAITRSVPVVGAWEEPEDWHTARPTLRVAGDRAYVTEPSTRRLVVVDLRAGTVVSETRLPHATDELVHVSGEAGGE